MGELRELIYLDVVSLNSHLSSIGRGIPSEIVRSAEDESEISGGISAHVGPIGGDLGGSDVDRTSIETTLSITAPYHFQDFLNALDQEEIEVYEDPDPRSLTRGDVVRITGQTIPMSLFKFEVAIRTIREIANPETQSQLDDIGEEEIDGDMDELEIVQSLIEKFTGDLVPLRVQSEGYEYGAGLHRSNMRVPPERAFLEEQDFTLVGRVDRRILSGNSWDPILATSIMDRYTQEGENIQEMRDQMEEVAQEVGMGLSPEDWELPGHTAVIHPIAMFW